MLPDIIFILILSSQEVNIKDKFQNFCLGEKFEDKI